MRTIVVCIDDHTVVPKLRVMATPDNFSVMLISHTFHFAPLASTVLPRVLAQREEPPEGGA